MTKNISEVKRQLSDLLAKVNDGAVSEAEALSAMNMALKISAKYGLSLDELKESEEGADIYRFESVSGKRYLHEVDMLLSHAITNFCDVKVWRSGGDVSYCGIQADIDLAVLVRAVLRKCMEFEFALYKDFEHTGPLRGARASFMVGFAQRVGDRMADAKEKTAHYSRDAKALIVVKGGLIERKMAEAGVKLGSGGRSKRTVFNGAANAAGGEAGGRANWGTATGGGTAAQITGGV